MDAEGKASLFYIKCDDPANDNAVIQEIHSTRGLEGFPVETVDEWLEEMTPNKIPGFNIALRVSLSSPWLSGFWPSSNPCIRRSSSGRGRLGFSSRWAHPS